MMHRPNPPVLHGYCILRADEAPDPAAVAGLGGLPVSAIGAGRLILWVSESRAEGATVERLRDHDRVVREALRYATPLPLRFGTSFRSEAEAIASLEDRDGSFNAALDRVAGRVEMGVRISLAAGASADPDVPAEAAEANPRLPPNLSGRSYLERRRAELEHSDRRRRHADQILADVERELDDPGCPSTRTVILRGSLIGTVAHLVQRERVRHYREWVAARLGHRGDLRFAVSGPWAPYSFV